jgi:hypothetical protein
MRGTYPAHVFYLDLVTPVMFGEKQNAVASSSFDSGFSSMYIQSLFGFGVK